MSAVLESKDSKIKYEAITVAPNKKPKMKFVPKQRPKAKGKKKHYK